LREASGRFLKKAPQKPLLNWTMGGGTFRPNVRFAPKSDMEWSMYPTRKRQDRDFSAFPAFSRALILRQSALDYC
jgi:hypothetical protein